LVAGHVRYGTRAGWGLLLAVVTGSAIAILDTTVVNVALPTIGADLDATFAELQWVVTGYTLTLAAFIMVSGSLADRLGRRRVYVWGALLSRSRPPCARRHPPSRSSSVPVCCKVSRVLR
jgi:MFS family permease